MACCMATEYSKLLTDDSQFVQQRTNHALTVVRHFERVSWLDLGIPRVLLHSSEVMWYGMVRMEWLYLVY